jgi:hypothetical protein
MRICKIVTKITNKIKIKKVRFMRCYVVCNFVGDKMKMKKLWIILNKLKKGMKIQIKSR